MEHLPIFMQHSEGWNKSYPIDDDHNLLSSISTILSFLSETFFEIKLIYYILVKWSTRLNRLFDEYLVIVWVQTNFHKENLHIFNYLGQNLKQISGRNG